ncbi:uncharacterized protein LOC111305511 isoform X2 [Durio zibethinus]|uniref:Uncharacterized protein LOC111305511 isoform X2 n=1 Tax=Durio zibethinus TaxID=66656 RepID=A0A6P6A1L0_DURZI|nr:uncharacterized protein LOC111305511 isoform X2 [Durio zibethinus]
MEDNCPSIKRHSLKTHPRFNNYSFWTDKLRENCYKRVREDRTRLLWKLRLPAAQSLNHKFLAEPEEWIETWEDEEDEYLARAVYEHLQLNDEQVHKQIWCPIYKQGELQQNHQLIYCSLCKLKLDRDDEVNLDMLRDRLAEAHADHFDRGCRLKPKFCQETRFGLAALYILCQDCSTFEVVI